MGNDFWVVIRFWSALFLIGAVAFPLTRLIFASWYDRGYLLSKSVGLVLVSYIVWLCASLKILPFSLPSVIASMVSIYFFGLAINFFVFNPGKDTVNRLESQSHAHNARPVFDNWWLIFLEEIFFLLALLFWAWVKGHEPSLQGLEKFMDYGFAKTITLTSYFPPPDMWYAGGVINYYYFGHFVMALMTKLSGLDLTIVFNLMLSSLFALCLTMSFTIGVQLQKLLHFGSDQRPVKKKAFFAILAGGILTAFLVTSAGNMQTLYAFTNGYTGEDVKPFWQLFWNPSEFWDKLPEGLNRYWYANATRFIPFTIHEFPSYSFVVSDIHGHVLSIPMALLAISLLLVIFSSKRYSEKRKDNGNHKMAIILDNGYFLRAGFYGLLVAVLFMTNALDGPIYIGIFGFLVISMSFHNRNSPAWTNDNQPGLLDNLLTFDWWKNKATAIFPVLVAGPALLPFLSNFKTFVSGIAVNCPPASLANQRYGLLIFEGTDKCQHSPFWMWWLLWGFFVFNFIFFILWGIKHNQTGLIHRFNGFKKWLPRLNIYAFLTNNFTHWEKVLVVFSVYSVLLLIFPEFFYFLDIYPAHFRSNTMFKLGYQAYMMLSIMSGYTIIKYLVRGNGIIASRAKGIVRRVFNIRMLFLILLVPQLFLVSIYPIFAVRSYFDSLRSYKELYGLQWLKDAYPSDYEAIIWLNTSRDLLKYVSTDSCRLLSSKPCQKLPVIVEADGESYTDYNRVSAFTGLPSIIGWPVHEWLWRGTYGVVAPRREDVRQIYESENVSLVQSILKKYNVHYVIIGVLEREKYPTVIPEKFADIGQKVFQHGSTYIYEITY